MISYYILLAWDLNEKKELVEVFILASIEVIIMVATILANIY